MKFNKIVTLALAISSSSCFAAADDFQLKILHINDHHSHLEADSRANLTIAGKATRIEMGGFPRVTAKIDELAAGKNNVLKLHAGDAITGTLFYSLFKGQADADLMNTVCFDAFGLGNHEFDDGDAGLRSFLDRLNSTECNTSTLAANVVPAIGSPLLPAVGYPYYEPYLEPFVIKEVNGEKIGIIGLDISNKTKNSSNPDESTQFLDEVRTVKYYAKVLRRQRVNKIILLTHFQYKNDIELAKAVVGIDVIVGGDSHTLLGDFDAVGLNSAGPYPTEVVGKARKKVCVVQAWQYSNMVGELDVLFDIKGNVLSCNGTPHLLVGNTFKRKNAEGIRVELEGEERDAVLNLISATDNISIVEPDAGAAQVLSQYQDRVNELKNASIGTISSDLCLERIPGQGNSSLCDVSLTNAHGSDISNIVARAFKEQSLESDIAIQNAGGVRIDIPAGDFSIGDAYTLLPFANTLVNLTMTGQEIVNVLEEAVEFATVAGGSTGAYPYASGLRWDVDLSKPAGSRFSNIEVKLKNDIEWTPIDLTFYYVVVTNSFVAKGKDGYTTFGTVAADGRMIDTFLDYAQSFVDYVKRVNAEGGTIYKLPAEDYSTQNIYDKDGNLQR